MTQPLAHRIAAFALATLMTLGMLGSIDTCAKTEGAQAGVLVAQAANVVRPA